MRNMGINVWNCFWTCHLKGCDFSRDQWQGMKCHYICVSILSFRSLHIPDPITLTDLEKTALHILSGFWLDWSFLHCSLLSLTRNHSSFATVLLLAHFFNIALQNCPKETMGIIDFSFFFVCDWCIHQNSFDKGSEEARKSEGNSSASRASGRC